MPAISSFSTMVENVSSASPASETSCSGPVALAPAAWLAGLDENSAHKLFWLVVFLGVVRLATTIIKRHYKLKEMELKVSSEASRSVQGTLNLAHLLQHKHTRALLVICERFNKEDAQERVILPEQVILAAVPFSWIMPCSPAKVEESSHEE